MLNEHLFDTDVHTEHCSVFSCKYGDENCPVVHRTRIASYSPYEDGDEYSEYEDISDRDSYYKFVWSKAEIKRFFSLLRPLEPHEVYFLSMSARNKYLTEAERVRYDLGRSEMFHRQIVGDSSFEAYLRVVHTLEVAKGGYQSRSNIDLPMKCLVIYANIGPLDGHLALKDFTTETLQRVFDNNDDKLYNRLPSILHNAFQKARSSKQKLLDIDFDVPHREGFPYLQELLLEFDKNEVQYEVVMTKSGFHVLVERTSLHYNYTQKISLLDVIVLDKFNGEVVTNTNGMIPLPGTRQAGHLVQFLNKE